MTRASASELKLSIAHGLINRRLAHVCVCVCVRPFSRRRAVLGDTVRTIRALGSAGIGIR